MDRKLDELLYVLMQNMTVAVSGERLAKDLGVSHSTLVRWIEKLRQAGVQILGELFTGYRLTRLPDVLLPQLIRPRLRTQNFGRVLYHFYTVDSTNAFALRLLSHERDVPDGAVILAESQTAGRGRLGRSWYSEPESGLYFSIILKPEVPSTLAPLFTLATAVALHRAVQQHTELDVDIKWPNDLLVSGKKVAGILAEIQAEVDRIHFLVVGIGLNVNHREMPGELTQGATSLFLASGRSWSRLELLSDFLEQFESIVRSFKLTGPAGVVSEWARRSTFAEGRHVRIRDGLREVEGVTCGLNPSGALRIQTDAGRVEDIYSGEVVFWE